MTLNAFPFIFVVVEIGERWRQTKKELNSNERRNYKFKNEK